MIPMGNIENNDFEIVTAPTKTFKVDFAENIARGFIDEIKAVDQAIYKILMTERYKHEIYSWNYGIVVNDLLGKPKSFARAVLPQRIEDALKVDDRIRTVRDFVFSAPDKTTLSVKFTVDTIYGELPIKWEVNYNV